MKIFGAFVAMLLLGLACGITVATLNIAFEPKNCGEDCANIAWTSLLTWAPICAVGFPVFGLPIWMRRGQTGRALLAICLILALIALVPAGGAYLYRAGLQTTE